ncbi:RagB/SusD family nutrient uptake outer membrane protein [Sphingobacterium sp. E70]|uniref:RagB/SusD family nutrient uptake outer membrane protein n=1 Tax=Sphingobacterium sp. E70 TaxID=2853439 RepID=UPI00359C999C|nr:RagB/SusD family nutrient uptake outer membrane protein [Sphingobacterium sp. E70]
MTDNAMVNLNTTYKPSAADEPWFLFASSHLLDNSPNDPYWGQLYKTIFYANTVLDKFKEVIPTGEEQSNYDRIKGEAFALRAYAYFYLINMYADVYAANNLELPGVPMPLDAVDVNEFSKNNVRQPLGKVWGRSKQIWDRPQIYCAESLRMIVFGSILRLCNYYAPVCHYLWDNMIRQ